MASASSLQGARTATLDNLDCGTSYSLAVDARDGADNRSARTAITAATEPCRPTKGDKPDTPAVPDTPGAPGAPDTPAEPDTPESSSPPSAGDGPHHPHTSEPDAPKAHPSKPETTDDGREHDNRPRSAVERRSPKAWSGRNERRRPASSPLGNGPLAVSSWLGRTVLVFGTVRLLNTTRFVTISTPPSIQRVETGRTAQNARVTKAYDRVSVRWEGRRFFSRGALELHLEWSGSSFETWVRQHPGALRRLRP